MPKRSKKPVDITVHMRRRDGRRVTEGEARRALWAAHKLVQAGKSLTQLREWSIEAIDWQNRHGKQYHYEGAKLADVLANAGGILETVGNAGIRVKPLRAGQPIESLPGESDGDA